MIRKILENRVNSSRVYLDRLNRDFAIKVPPGALVLDAASGSQLYRPLFDHARYESADFEEVDKYYQPSASSFSCREFLAARRRSGGRAQVDMDQFNGRRPAPLKVCN